MSKEVKRYDSISNDGACGMMIEDADYGTYVEYADYEREVRCAIAAGIRMQDKCAALEVERDAEAESCKQWRTMALQFDRHRMSALAHLKMVVADQEGAMDVCRDFLSAPPVHGHAITEEVDQLRAKVEELRVLLSKSLPIVEAHAGASHMLEGFRPKRNKWDELVDGIRAALTAKDADKI